MNYTYTVTAYDISNNESDGSTPLTIRTIDNEPPGKPGTQTFSSITGTSVVASWTAATDNAGVVSYEYSIDGGATWTSVGNVLTRTISGLNAGTGYTLLVRARDAVNLPGASGNHWRSEQSIATWGWRGEFCASANDSGETRPLASVGYL